MSCEICCAKLNNSTHAPISCPFNCGLTACKTCIRKYLLGTTADPHCMNCKKGFSYKFLVENLNRTFCEKEYKIHREQLLLEREISKLPETMPIVERTKKVQVEEQKYNQVGEEISTLKKAIKKLQTKQSDIANTIWHIKNGKTGEHSEKRQFIMSCPNNNCRGYLSTQYKCELCEMFTCPRCSELIGHSKTDPHECNPNSVASTEAIKKETKPCPSCGIRIFKISGCDQMWCTECKVAFHYNTGRIDTGVVHNPHYYAHLSQLNRGEAPRNPRDVVCGGLIDAYYLVRMFKVIKTAFSNVDEQTAFETYIMDIHRVLAHITHVELPRLRTKIRELEETTNLRVNYILGKISKEQLTQNIYKQDIKRKKQTELLHIYELLNVVGIENMNVFHEVPKCPVAKRSEFIEDVNKKMITLDNLREYCNTEFSKISITYNQSVPWISDLWKISTRKYRMSEVKDQ